MTDTTVANAPAPKAAPKKPSAKSVAKQKAVGKKAVKALAKSLKTKPATKAKPAKAKQPSLVDKLIALLKTAKGATNEEAAKALGFKTPQSVRGTINGPVRKRETVKKRKDDKRGTVYFIK